MAAVAIVYLLLIIAWAVTPAPVSTILGAIILIIAFGEVFNVIRGWRAGEFNYDSAHPQKPKRPEPDWNQDVQC